MGGRGRDCHTCRSVVDPALGHAEGRALTLHLALGLGGGAECGGPMLVQLLSCPQFS